MLLILGVKSIYDERFLGVMKYLGPDINYKYRVYN